MTRLSIQFSEQQKQRLNEMAVELGTTKAGVLKSALSLLAVALRERREGNCIGVVRGNKVIKGIVGIE